MLASTPHFGIVGLTVEKDVPNLNDNRCWLQCATHWCLFKEDILGFTIHNPELIMLKKKKVIETEVPWKKCTTLNEKIMIIVFHIKIHEISPEAIQKSNGLKVTYLMSLYFKSEEDTMTKEII